MLFLAPVPFFMLAIAVIGVAMVPAMWVGAYLWALSDSSTSLLKYFLRGLSLPVGFYIYGFSLLLVAPLVSFVMGGRLKPYRGSPVSFKCIGWYVQAALTFVVRYSFLEFITPTVYLNAYFRLMGMKIGKNVYINSTHICDPSMIELGNGCTIGGSANIMGHYASGDFMVIAPVKIHRKAVVGYGVTIMGDVEIGEGAKVLANSFVLPKTRIPAGEIWGGVPAVRQNLPVKDPAIIKGTLD